MKGLYGLLWWLKSEGKDVMSAERQRKVACAGCRVVAGAKKVAYMRRRRNSKRPTLFERPHDWTSQGNWDNLSGNTPSL